MNLSLQTIERFLSKVDKTPGHGPNGDCWLWTASLNNNGYGRIFIKTGKVDRSHRVAYQLFIGEIPDGLNVLHECDVRNCVNWRHLYLGTQQKNLKDAVKRGRRRDRRGIKHPRAKLTEISIEHIRQLLTKGFSIRKIAKMFNVSHTAISFIKHRKTWDCYY